VAFWTYSEAFLLAKGCLDPHCVWVVVRDKTTVSTDALGGDGAFVHQFLSASSWKLLVLERAVLSTSTSVLVTGPADMEEAPAEQRNPNQYLSARHARSHEIVYPRRDRRLVFDHRVKLGMVASPVGPRAVEVVGCQIDSVKVFGCAPEVDGLEDRPSSRESGREQEAVFRKMNADRRKQGKEVIPLLRGAGVFPDD
jgi:hypothetical protein